MTIEDSEEYDVLAGGSERPPASAAVRRRTAGRALGAGSLVLAVLAGGAVYVAARSGGGGSGPETVLPGNAFAFAAVDLEPSGSQRDGLADFVRRFPSARSDDADELRERAVTLLTKSFDLDYASDVKPWLGGHLAIAAFPVAKGRPQSVIAVEATDVAAAKTALAGMNDPPAVATSANYLLIASTQQTLDAALAAAETPLSKNPAFSADLAKLDGAQIAVGWVDNPRAADAFLYDMEHPAPNESFGGMDTYLSRIRAGAVGRTVAGLKAHGTYAEIVGYTVDRGNVEAAPAGVLHKLPDTTIGAAFAASGDSLLVGEGGGPFAGLGIAGQLPTMGLGLSSMLFSFAGGYSEVSHGSETAAASACAAPSPSPDGWSAVDCPVPTVVPSRLATAIPVPSEALTLPPQPAISPAAPPGQAELDKSAAAEIRVSPDTETYVDPTEEMATELAGGVGAVTFALGSWPVPGSNRAPNMALVATVKDATRADKLATRVKTQFASAFGEQPFSKVDGGVLTLASDAEYAGALGAGTLGDSALFKAAMGALGDDVEVAVFANLERVRDALPGYPKEWLPVSAIGMSSSRQGNDSVVRVRLVAR